MEYKIKNIFKFLNKPYPFNGDFKRNSKIIFLISIAVFIFFLLFQPLDISSLIKKEKFFLITGFGIITFLSLSLNLLLIPSFFQRLFNRGKWNILKEIIWNLIILLTVSVGYFAYYKIVGKFEIDSFLIVKIIFIAIFPITVLIIFNQNRLLRSHLKSAKELNTKLQEKKQIQDVKILFKSNYLKDNLLIKISSLLFIRSANNYIEVFWKEKNAIKNQLIRTSLLKAEELIKNFEFVIKCHRSFIINVNHIDKIEGNSQGYKLFYNQINFAIPVSKKYIEQFKKLI